MTINNLWGGGGAQAHGLLTVRTIALITLMESAPMIIDNTLNTQYQSYRIVSYVSSDMRFSEYVNVVEVFA